MYRVRRIFFDIFDAWKIQKFRFSKRKRKANILHDMWKIQKFQFSITFSLYNYRCPEKKISKYVKIQKFRFSIIFTYNYRCTKKEISGYVKIQKFRFSIASLYNYRCSEKKISGYVKIQKFRFSIVSLYSYRCTEEEILGNFRNSKISVFDNFHDFQLHRGGNVRRIPFTTRGKFRFSTFTYGDRCAERET